MVWAPSAARAALIAVSTCAWLDTTPVSRISPLVVTTVVFSPAKPGSLLSAELTWVVISTSETFAAALVAGSWFGPGLSGFLHAVSSNVQQAETL